MTGKKAPIFGTGSNCGREHPEGEFCSVRQPVANVSTKRIARNALRLWWEWVRLDFKMRRGLVDYRLADRRDALIEQMDELGNELEFRRYLRKELQNGYPGHYVIGADNMSLLDIEVEYQGVPEDSPLADWDDDPL